MLACVHQPNYLPWLGFFAKVARADVYLVMDNVQFSRNCWTNRVQVAGNGDPLWLTVPVRRGGLETPIADAEIDHTRDWVKQQRSTLEARYGRCQHFKAVYPELVQILEARPRRLVALNLPLIRWVMEACGISTRVVLGSELNATGKASELVVALCRAVGATAYLAGQGSVDYEDLALYERAGIRYQRQEFQHREYPQHGRAQFVAGLSVIDALFNVGVAGARQLLAAQLPAAGPCP